MMINDEVRTLKQFGRYGEGVSAFAAISTQLGYQNTHNESNTQRRLLPLSLYLIITTDAKDADSSVVEGASPFWYLLEKI